MSSATVSLSEIYKRYPIDPFCQIRLLEIEWTDGPRTSRSRPEIKSLTFCSQSDPRKVPEYAALSYRWSSGDEKDTYSIPFCGGRIDVGHNLWLFLQELPGLILKEPQLPKFFFIDQLCVNQSSTEELEAQTTLFPEIYSSATCVLSWLGPYGDASDLAMRYLSLRCQYSEQRLSILFEPPKVVIKALGGVFSRPNWRRLWIVPEILLARELWMMCGSEIVNGEHFYRFFSEPNLASDPRLDRLPARNFFEERERLRKPGKTSPELLRSIFLYVQSTNPNDAKKVFEAISNAATGTINLNLNILRPPLPTHTASGSIHFRKAPFPSTDGRKPQSPTRNSRHDSPNKKEKAVSNIGLRSQKSNTSHSSRTAMSEFTSLGRQTPFPKMLSDSSAQLERMEGIRRTRGWLISSNNAS